MVCYTVVVNEDRELLLVSHRKAGLWLPPGGHVEVDEDPWQTVVREVREELAIDAEPLAGFGRDPFFLTVTTTRGPGQDTDVSFWYLLRAETDDVRHEDNSEFVDIKWLSPPAILAESADLLGPHLHRFTAK